MQTSFANILFRQKRERKKERKKEKKKEKKKDRKKERQKERKKERKNLQAKKIMFALAYYLPGKTFKSGFGEGEEKNK